MKQRPDDTILGNIRMLLTDVDGVLTDGHIHFDGEGREVKTFHVHDGAGMVYWHRAGGLSGFVSGRGSEVVKERGKELGVHEMYLGRLDKITVIEEIAARRQLELGQIAYVGDDLADLPALKVVGFAATVPQGRPELFDHVHHITRVPGGKGAIREIIEILLQARGKWDDVVRQGGQP